ncbi:MAG: pyridoxamine 5'-phosphate oxidase family protein [Pseudomonadota bacterium]
MENYAELMFTKAVADLQKAEGTHEKYKTAYQHRTQDELDEATIGFIESRNSFYIATVNSEGWPYIQHRGGPRGFVKVVGANTLACADYAGNRQFITMGNLDQEPKVSLFFMDYLNHVRLKLQGKARLLSAEDADPNLLELVKTADLETQRVLTVDVVALDWNCPKYIPTLFSEENVRTLLDRQDEQTRSVDQDNPQGRT